MANCGGNLAETSSATIAPAAPDFATCSRKLCASKFSPRKATNNSLGLIVRERRRMPQAGLQATIYRLNRPTSKTTNSRLNTKSSFTRDVSKPGRMVGDRGGAVGANYDITCSAKNGDINIKVPQNESNSNKSTRSNKKDKMIGALKNELIVAAPTGNTFGGVFESQGGSVPSWAPRCAHCDDIGRLPDSTLCGCEEGAAVKARLLR